MDNCSHNGEKLQSSIVTMAKEWSKKGFVEEEFVAYITDEAQVSFPWSMIDKITPRPADSVCQELEKAGIEDMLRLLLPKRPTLLLLSMQRDPSIWLSRTNSPTEDLLLRRPAYI